MSCQKPPPGQHSQDEVIIEFAARLEEHSPEYHYDHSNIQKSNIKPESLNLHKL